MGGSWGCGLRGCGGWFAVVGLRLRAELFTVSRN